MKKITWFIMFALIVQAGYKITPALAQESKEMVEIKKVVENYFESFARQDINSMMNQISLNYSSKDKSGNIIDYNKFRSNLEGRMQERLKQYADYSITGFEIITLDVKDNKATLLFIYSWKGLNLNTTKEESGRLSRSVSLAREGDSWKITNIRWIP